MSRPGKRVPLMCAGQVAPLRVIRQQRAPAAREEFEVPPRVHGALVSNVDPSSAAAEAGLTPGEIAVPIRGDGGFEPSEAFTVALTQPVGAALARAQVDVRQEGGSHVKLRTGIDAHVLLTPA